LCGAAALREKHQGLPPPSFYGRLLSTWASL
jgi:hypothetical protein